MSGKIGSGTVLSLAAEEIGEDGSGRCGRSIGLSSIIRTPDAKRRSTASFFYRSKHAAGEVRTDDEENGTAVRVRTPMDMQFHDL